MAEPVRSTASDEHLKVVARGGIANLLGSVVGAVGMVGLVLVIARQLDVSRAGEFFVLTSVFLVFTALSSLGTDAGLGRFLLRYEILDRRSDIGETIRVTTVPVLSTALIFATLLFLVADPGVGLLGVSDPTGATALRVLAVGVPVACLSDLTFAGTRAFGRVGPTIVFDRIIRSLSQPLLVWLATMQTNRLDAIAAAWVLPYLFSLAGGLVCLRSVLKTRDVHPTWRSTGRTAVVRREFWSFTWARGVTQVAQLVIQRADIVLIAALRSPREAAIYTAATRFVPLGQMAVVSFQQVIQPRLTIAIAEQDDESLRQVFRTGTVWAMLVSWPVYALVGAAPVIYLSVFGQAYGEAGVPVVIVMALAMAIGAACGPVDTLILMLGRSRTSLGNILVALTVNIGLGVLLIPSLGMLGAALAWFASRATQSALGLVQVRRLTKVTPVSSSSLLAGGLALGLVGLPVLTGSLLGLGTLEQLALIVLVGALYVGALVVFRRQLGLAGLDLLRRERPTVQGAT